MHLNTDQKVQNNSIQLSSIQFGTVWYISIQMNTVQ